MKELKVEIKDSYRDRGSLKVNTAIVALQPQMAQEVQGGWQHLVTQAQYINQLAAELEAAMFELKAIANTLNSQRRYLLENSQPLKSVCEYLATSVPYVGQQQDGSLIVTTRTVDLFRAEREAALVAQALRHRAKRKQSALRPHRTNKLDALTQRGAYPKKKKSEN